MRPADNGGGRPLELYAIAPTLFREDGARIDTEAMSENVARIGRAGMSSVLVAGSYGEFQSLTDDERVQVVRAVRSQCEATLMACAALPSSTATAELAARLFDAGADLVMVSAPLVAELSDADIRRHFEYLAERASGPLVIYNNPVFGIDLSPEQLGEAAALPSIAAVKQGTRVIGGLIQSLWAVARASNGRVRVLAASDMSAAVSLPAGVDGLTSTNVWIFPEVFLEMIAAADAADWGRVRLATEALEPYYAAARRLGQPRTVKAAMQLRDYAGTDAIRLPYASLNGTERAMLADAVSQSDHAVRELAVDHAGVQK